MLIVLNQQFLAKIMEMKEFVESIILEAGDILEKRFREAVNVEVKGDRDLVTSVDREIEAFLTCKIQEKYPNHSILGEESGKSGQSDKMWTIDPIDGTKNFVTRTPVFNIAIAYLENNKPVLGFVYNPIMKELFYAEKNKGAFLNGEQICVSKKDKLIESSVYFCRGLTDEAIKRSTKYYSVLAPKTLSLRQFGSAQLELCYVASGRIEAFYVNNFSIWDITAGWLIVEEAGGKVTDFKGAPMTSNSNDLLASNGKIHDVLLENLDASGI